MKTILRYGIMGFIFVLVSGWLAKDLITQFPSVFGSLDQNRNQSFGVTLLISVSSVILAVTFITVVLRLLFILGNLREMILEKTKDEKGEPAPMGVQYALLYGN